MASGKDLTPQELRELSYTEYLTTSHWQRVREQAKLRARMCCEACGQSGDLDVHHLSYERRGAERPDDVQVLCRDCHRDQHPSWVDECPDQAERMRRALWAEERYPDARWSHEPFESTASPVRDPDAPEFDLQEWWEEQVGDWEDNL